MNLEDRIECAASIAEGLKPKKEIDSKVIYDLQMHLSYALEQVKNNGALADVSKQRELLITFIEWYDNQQIFISNATGIEVKVIDEFIKSNL